MLTIDIRLDFQILIGWYVTVTNVQVAFTSKLSVRMFHALKKSFENNRDNALFYVEVTSKPRTPATANQFMKFCTRIISRHRSIQ